MYKKIRVSQTSMAVLLTLSVGLMGESILNSETKGMGMMNVHTRIKLVLGRIWDQHPNL